MNIQSQGYTGHDEREIKVWPFAVGIGGPVGAGKTSMTEALCQAMGDDVSAAVITNDITHLRIILSALRPYPQTAFAGGNRRMSAYRYADASQT